MEIDVIGVPLFYGCDTEGVENGPDKLRELGLVELFERNRNNVLDKGNVAVPVSGPDKKYKSDKLMKYLDEIVETCQNLATEVEDTLRRGRLPFIIGGDHSLVMGSLAGVSSVIGDDYAVIWIDAHTDINTDKTSQTGNIHGMPLASSMGVGPDILTSIYHDVPKVRDRNVYIIGARSIDEGEQALIDERGLNVWRIEDVHARGMDAIIKELMAKISESGVRDVHISYDIDSLDKSLVPGTGTPVENGLRLEESKRLVEAIIGTGKVRSVDFVEYNPDIDLDNRTAQSCLYMLNVFAASLGGVRTLASSAVSR